jgi:hypothetical protein
MEGRGAYMMRWHDELLARHGRENIGLPVGPDD